MTPQSSGQPPELSVQEIAEILKNEPETRVLDVRTPGELATASVAGFEALDEATAKALIEGADRDAKLVFSCHHGMRSLAAGAAFMEQGFKNVYSMAGGIDAWSLEIDVDVPRY